MTASAAPPVRGLSMVAASLAVWGPGLLVMLADTDVGNIVAAAQAGTQFGYRLLPLPLLLIPLLFMVQELTVRIGLFSGRGFGGLIRIEYGPVWAWLAGAALTVATVGSIVTEMVGIAGVGEMVGVSRWVALPLADLCLLSIMLSGSYRRVERVVVLIGLFELSFVAVAIASHPRLADVDRDILRQPLGDPGYLYVGAALLGSTFNPWMIFYQPSALAQKRLDRRHYRAARSDTAAGAVLTQCVTAAVLVAVAATLGGQSASLADVGQISAALTPLLGSVLGRLVFGVGVTGAAIVAAVVCSLAFAWGLAEVAGVDTARRPFGGRWFGLLYVGGVIGGSALVLLAPNLVWLTIFAEVVNALLMPLVVGLLVVLAATRLPADWRLRGWYLWLVAATAVLVSGTGFVAAVAGLLA